MKNFEKSKIVKNTFLTVFTMVIIGLCFIAGGRNVYAATDDVVYIPDDNFKKVLNIILGVDDPAEDITEGQMVRITELTIYSDVGVTDITGISYCTNLRKLDLKKRGSKEWELDKKFIDNLLKLSNIEELKLSGVISDDYSFISKMKWLQVLDIEDCNITVFPELINSTYLSKLSLSNCESLIEVSALKKLIKLDTFIVEGSFGTFPLVKEMEKLTYLRVSNMPITEDNEKVFMETIASLKNIKRLYIDDCNFTDRYTMMFDGLTKLEVLSLCNNTISNFDFLLKHKENIKQLYIEDSKATNNLAVVLPQMTNLCVLKINNSNIPDLSFVSKMSEKFLFSESVVTGKLPRLCSTIKVVCNEDEYPIKYTFINDVKDHNGNYAAPELSGLYTYKDKSREITISTGYTKSFDIVYNFKLEAPNGDKYNARHVKTVCYEKLSDRLPIIGDVELLEGDILELNVQMDKFEAFENVKYQWYKDGNKIEGATGANLRIKNVQASDCGQYRVIVSSANTIIVSDKVMITVGTLKELTGILHITGAKNNMTAYVGDQIRCIVSADGGSYEYKYQHILETNSTGMTHVPYTTDNTTKYICDTVGENVFYSIIYDSKGNMVKTNRVSIMVYNAFASKFEIQGISENSTCKEGDVITFNAFAEGGSEKYTYNYTVYNKNKDKWYTIAENVTDSTYLWTTDMCGEVMLYIEAKDSFGASLKSEGFQIKILRQPGLYKEDDGNWYYFNEEKIETSYTGMAKNKYGWWYVKDGKVDFTYTGMAKNANGWWYMKNGKLDLTYTGLATNSNGTWYMKKGKLDTSASGLVKTSSGWVYLTKGKLNSSYTGLVENANGWWYVKEGKIDFTYTGIVTNCQEIWYVKEGKLDTTLLDSEQNKDGYWCVNEGEKLVISAIYGEEIKDYTYSFIVYNKDTKKWARVADNISSNKFTWRAGSAGNRVFYVDVKDATGNIVRSSAINVKVVNTLSIKATTTAKEVVTGGKITITATVQGGIDSNSNSYTYSFIVYNKDTKKWARIADNITSNTFTWTAGSVGNRVFYVDVKDSTGRIVRSKGIDVSVVTKVKELCVTASASESNVKVGNSVTFKATAIGGSGVYTYSVIVYNKDTKEWARISNNTISSTFTWKAKSSGNRTFYVDAKDSTGKIVRSEAIAVSVK